MDVVRAANGRFVTDEMLTRWCEALDKDEWPSGEHSVGEPISGRPPLSVEGSTVLSVKVSPAMKRAIESEAKAQGVSTSELVRTMLASGLLEKGLAPA
ncbi:MAG: ribbon-helix-helix domain-containing protein [Coriobacteriales bacterium]|jgi:hypothetical protein|nr:ribbon-helix-helix domain-containing protein [Coriobacteriales bacterium]